MYPKTQSRFGNRSLKRQIHTPHQTPGPLKRQEINGNEKPTPLFHYPEERTDTSDHRYTSSTSNKLDYHNGAGELFRSKLNDLDSLEGVSKLFEADDFTTKYKYYGFESFMEKGLITKDQLRQLQKENPTCLEALKEIHVITALDVDTSEFRPEHIIEISDLVNLDATTLDKIINCGESDRIKKIIEEAKSEKLMPSSATAA